MIPGMRAVHLIACCLLPGLIALSAAPVPSTDWAPPVDPLPSPAGPDSGQPQLSVSSAGTILSWVERTGSRAVLKFSRRTPNGWESPREVAAGTDWFVNWADVPSVVQLDDGTLAAHWLQKSGPGTYAYDVRLAYSRDDGKTWSPSFTPHHDGTQTEHGFASLFTVPAGGLGVAWLDGRAMKMESGAHEGSGDMSLRFAAFGPDWQPRSEALLDARVCECCPTAVALTSDGPLVAYRDRSPDEVRDIYVTRLENGRWTQPHAVHADNWRVPACPVNGPALSASGRDVAIAWFTARDDAPKSFVAFSADAGRTFGTPIRLDDDASLGRVDVERLPDGSAIAAYVEFADRRASFRVRRVTRDGQRSAPVIVSGMAGNRTSGLPRMVRQGDELLFAWVDRGEGSRVETARARLR